MKLLIICLESSEDRLLAKQMNAQYTAAQAHHFICALVWLLYYNGIGDTIIATATIITTTIANTTTAIITTTTTK